MKFQVMSDLHLEFQPDLGGYLIASLPVEAETLILAGDCFSGAHRGNYCEFFQMFAEKWKNVFYVFGNHDFYGGSPQAVAMEMKKASILTPGFEILTREKSHLVEGVEVLGCTMWFPNTQGYNENKKYMTDFRVINDFDSWVGPEHQADLAYLESKATRGQIPQLVVTHHLPHERSIDPRFKRSALNAFFYAPEAQPLVENGGFRVWVHGHTHAPCDYTVNDTRVVCNPRGYSGEGAPFKEGFVVEV